jgi:PAS domain S-box-containing protein/putative nucleotidyltransferase with HDIG domain
MLRPISDAGQSDLLANVIEAVDAGIIAADLDGTITAWNRGAERMYGYTAGQVIGRKVSILAPPALGDEPMGIIRRISAGESSVRCETMRARNDGQLLECVISAWPLKDDDHRTVGVCAIVQDLTEVKQLSRNVLERETQLHGLLEQLVSGVFIVSGSGEILYVNEGFSRLFGYTREEVVGHAFLDYVHPADHERVRTSMTVTLTGVARQSETRVVARDGSVHTLLAHATRVQFEGQAALLGVTIDVTEQKVTKLALERANRLLRTIGAANEALVRAHTEADLTQSMCDVLVTVGGLRAAIITLVGDSGGLHHAAAAGAEPGAVTDLEVCCAGADHARKAMQRGAPVFDANRGLAWLPLDQQAVPLGCLCLRFKEAGELCADTVTLLVELADDLSYGVIALRRRVEHEASAERLQRSMEDTIAALAATLEMRDPYTAGHQRHVAELAVAIAREMGLDESRVHAVRLAAIVHDIGKIKIPTELLTKPGPLTRLEEQLLQTHAEAGYELLRGIDFPWPIADVVRQHHERVDGSGYPRALREPDILVEAQVLAVADVIEAMSADRPYRSGRGIDIALAEIRDGRGTLYGAPVVDACLVLFTEKGFEFSARQDGPPPDPGRL